MKRNAIFSIFAFMCFQMFLFVVFYVFMSRNMCFKSDFAFLHNQPSNQLKRSRSNKNMIQNGENIDAIENQAQQFRGNATSSQNRFLWCQKPTGRLGNAMFDFAVAYGIAHTLNYTFVIRSRYRLLKYFELNQTINDNMENIMKIPLKKWRDPEWRERKTYMWHNVTLKGYYRVWRYFHEVSNDVRKALTIKPEYLNTVKEFLRSSTPSEKTLIGVHVRRGDFLSDGSKKKGRIAASSEYISRAMNYFRMLHTDALFIILSVDQIWCKENIFGHDIIYSPFKKPILDMALLSLCDHVILTAGTFGWWGGWLSGGTVVYCKDFPKPGSFLEEKILFKDEFYPPRWVSFENCSL